MKRVCHWRCAPQVCCCGVSFGFVLTSLFFREFGIKARFGGLERPSAGRECCKRKPDAVPELYGFLFKVYVGLKSGLRPGFPFNDDGYDVCRSPAEAANRWPRCHCDSAVPADHWAVSGATWLVNAS